MRCTSWLLTGGDSMKLFWIGVAIYFTLTLLDLYCSWWLITRECGDLFYEANPLMAIVLARFGWPGVACAKAVCALMATGCLRLAHGMGKARLVGWTLLSMCLIMSAVVAILVGMAADYTILGVR